METQRIHENREDSMTTTVIRTSYSTQPIITGNIFQATSTLPESAIREILIELHDIRLAVKILDLLAVDRKNGALSFRSRIKIPEQIDISKLERITFTDKKGKKWEFVNMSLVAKRV